MLTDVCVFGFVQRPCMAVDAGLGWEAGAAAGAAEEMSEGEGEGEGKREGEGEGEGGSGGGGSGGGGGVDGGGSGGGSSGDGDVSGRVVAGAESAEGGGGAGVGGRGEGVDASCRLLLGRWSGSETDPSHSTARTTRTARASLSSSNVPFSHLPSASSFGSPPFPPPPSPSSAFSRPSRSVLGAAPALPRSFTAGALFDVVLVDYLVGAVEGFEPYAQRAVLSKVGGGRCSNHQPSHYSRWTVRANTLFKQIGRDWYRSQIGRD
jgi:hypothetical protein